MIGGGASRTEKKFKSLTRLLTEKLREAIVSGKFAPGERLAEETLSVSLHVGRVALREALRSLATFVDAQSVALGRVTPRRLRGPLARALAVAPSGTAITAASP